MIELEFGRAVYPSQANTTLKNLESHVDELRGAYSAVFTPFDRSGDVSLDILSQIINFQLAHGLKGFFVTGSTGEGLLLSYDERLAVIRHVVEHCNGRGTVIAHVGHPSTEYASRLAKDAADTGADWIASVGPIYYGTTFEGAMRHYQQIAAATDRPFMVYAIDQDIQWKRDRALFEIPNVCGMKYTGSNFYSVQQLARRVERPVAWISGFDEQFVASLSFGFQGGIGTTFNFAPQFYSEIYRCYLDGEIHRAAKLQSQINQVTDLMVQYENRSYQKAIMRFIGFDCGACRPPYAPLTDQEYDAFGRELDELNILERDQATIK